MGVGVVASSSRSRSAATTLKWPSSSTAPHLRLPERVQGKPVAAGRVIGVTTWCLVTPAPRPRLRVGLSGRCGFSVWLQGFRRNAYESFRDDED